MSEEITNPVEEPTEPTTGETEPVILAQDLANFLFPAYKYLTKDANDVVKAWKEAPELNNNNEQWVSQRINNTPKEIPVFVEFEGPDMQYWLVSKESTLNIEVGKFYRLVDNQKAFISSIVDNKANGVIVDMDDMHVWDLQGKYYIESMSDRDIFEEWTDL